ncbi:MAG: diguanylate cyclase [Nitrospirota bacterium]
MNAVILSGLIIYGIFSGWGLFLPDGPFHRFLVYWVAGYVILIFLVSYRALFLRSDRFTAFFSFLLGIIGLHGIIHSAGPVSSFLFLYFMVISFSVFFHRIGAYLFAAFILCIEAANLVLGFSPSLNWQSLGIFGMALFGTAYITTQLSSRIQAKADIAQQRYNKLLADAKAVDPLEGDTQVEALTETRRQATNVNAACERETAFTALLDMIGRIVPIHTCALYLDDHGAGTYALQKLQSKQPAATVTSSIVQSGNGLIGMCAAQNQIQYIPDKVISSRSLGYYSQDVPIRSLLALPLSQNSNASGVLVLDSLEPDAFPPEVQLVLSGFLPLFNQTIEHVRVSLELDIKAKNFAALHEMSSILSSSLEIRDILNKLVAQIKSAVPFDVCAFLLYDETSGDLTFTALHGYDQRFLESSFPLAQSSILSHMYHEWLDRESVTSYHDSDLGERGREIGLFPFRELQHPLKSIFGKPLVAGGKFLGAAVCGSVRRQVFTDYHCNFLDTLLSQVSMVVDNSLMHRNICDMARTDGLTGLLNHRTFMEKLADEYKRLDRDPRPFSILLVDIDFFKKINDTYGHPVGDLALANVAGVLKDMVRGSDFVARYGGEEFAVGMVDADSTGAHQMAERVRKTVEKMRIAAGKAEFQMTISIGVASFPSDTRKLEKLVGFSDEALYYAKRTGRNRVCLYRDAYQASSAEKDRPE